MYNYQGFIAMSYYVIVNRWKSLYVPVKSHVFNMGYFVLASSSGLLVACVLESSQYTPPFPSTDVLQVFCTWSPSAPCHIYHTDKGEIWTEFVNVYNHIG